MNKLSFIIVELITILALIAIPFEVHKEREVGKNITTTIVIDPGHGGKDNGCSNKDIYEDDINLSIAYFLFEELQNNSYSCYMTRTGDYDLSSENAKNHKNEDLRNRVDIVNNYQADILVSLHVNSYDNENIYGPMVYYRYADEESKLLGEFIQKELNNISGLNKKIHSEDFYLFRNTTCPAVLVECGFISNFQEKEKLTSLTYQKMLSKKIFEGVISYLES